MFANYVSLPHLNMPKGGWGWCLLIMSLSPTSTCQRGGGAGVQGRVHIVFWTYLVGVDISVNVKLLVRSVIWIPFGIFWWYLVEMYIRTRWHVAYKIDNFVFLTFGVISLCFIWKRFHICFVTGIPFGIFQWYLIEICCFCDLFDNIYANEHFYRYIVITYCFIWFKYRILN